MVDLNAAVEHADIGDDPFVGIIVRIKDQRPQRPLGRALWRTNTLHYSLQHSIGADPLLGRDLQHIFSRHIQQGLQLLGNLIGHGRGQIDLVDHRHNIQIMLKGHIEVSQGLSLDP